MRDSITTLEKCLDYNNNLTLENVMKVTSNGVDETVLFNLIKAILQKNSKEALLIFNEVYMSGIEISLFLKLFLDFISNCVKYIITADSSIVSLSDIIIEWLANNSNLVDQLKNYLYELTRHNVNYMNNDLKILLESWIIKVCN